MFEELDPTTTMFVLVSRAALRKGERSPALVQGPRLGAVVWSPLHRNLAMAPRSLRPALIVSL